MQKVILSIFLLFALELVTIIEVGSYIGAINTLLMLFAAFAIGCSLIKNRFSKVMRGDLSGSGIIVPVAGLLFIFPGFISDLIALVLLFPPVQKKFHEHYKAKFGGGFGFSFRNNVDNPQRNFKKGRVIDATPVNEDEKDSK